MINFDEYEKIVVGIGDLFNTNIENEENISEIDKLMYVKANADTRVIDSYKKLAAMLAGKDYFVVTTCTDDIIYDCGFDPERIVSPCGGFRFFQCVDDCNHKLLPFYEQALEEKSLPKCPHCGKDIVFNRLPVDKYNEGGYLDMWEKYNQFLQSTVNKKLLLLELGVGMKYPSVIRFAFEKIATYNKKSQMYRVHPTLAFAIPEIKESCQCISANPVEFLSEM